MSLNHIPISWRSNAAGPFPNMGHGSVIGSTSGSIPVSLASGTHGYALVADSSTDSGLGWAAFAGSNFYLDGLSFGTDSKITGSMSGVGDVTSNAMTTFTPATTFTAEASFTTGLVVGGNATAAGYIKINPDTDDTGDFPTTLKVGVNTEAQTYTLPLAYPTSSGYALVSTDAGVMSWATNTDANYYTSSASLSAGTLTGVIAGGGSNWTANLSAVATGSITSSTQYYNTFYNSSTGLVGSNRLQTDGSNNIILSGASNIAKTAADFQSTLGVSGALTVSGATNIIDTLNVTGNTVIEGTSLLSGNTTITGSLAGTTSANFGTTLEATGNVILGGTVMASGAVTAKSTVDVGSTLTVTGATTAKSNLTVTGTSDLKSTTTVGTGSTTKFTLEPEDQAERILITGTKVTTAATEYAYVPYILLHNNQTGGTLSQPGYPSIYFTKYGPISAGNPAGDPVGWRIAASGAGGIATAPQAMVWEFNADTGASSYASIMDLNQQGHLTAVSFMGSLSGTIDSATTATTQSSSDNSTKVATTAYADAAASGGGISSPLTTKGDIWVYTSTNARLGVGTNADVLTADSSTATGLAWATPTTGTIAGSIATDQIAFGASANTIEGTGDLTWTHDTGILALNSRMKIVSAGALGVSAYFQPLQDDKNIEFREYGGTTVLAIDNSNQRVGIGTTTPTEKLHVYDSTSSNQLGIYGDSGDVTAINMYEGVTKSAELLFEGSSNDLKLINRISGGDMIFRVDNNTEAMRIETGGQIGIGTTTPLAAAKLTLSDSTSTYLNFKPQATHNNWTIGADANGFIFYDETVGGYRMVIDDDGDVGIGTGSPTRKLDVRGTTLLSGGTLITGTLETTGKVTIDNELQINGGGDSTNTHLNLSDAGTNIISHASTGATTIRGNGASGDSMFKVESDGDVIHYYNSIFSGSVGVGGLITASGGITLPATSDNFTMGAHAVNDIKIYSDTVSTSDSDLVTAKYVGTHYAPVAITGTIGGSITDNQVAFGASSANSIEGSSTFIFDGSLGVGTASPANRIEAYGTGHEKVIATSTGDAHAVGFQAEQDADGTSQKWQMQTAAGTTGFQIRDATDGRVDMHFDGAGNVGIGTTAPNDLLDVRGNIQTSGTFFLSGSDLGGKIARVDTNEVALYAGTTEEMRLGVTNSYLKGTNWHFAGSGYMRISGTNTQLQFEDDEHYIYSDGTDLHIKTTTTASQDIALTSTGKLVVDAGDDINLDAHSSVFNFKRQGSEMFRLTCGASSPIAFQPKQDAYDIAFNQYDGTEVMRITDNARVGIGTAAPNSTSLLDVRGKIWSYSSDGTGITMASSTKTDGWELRSNGTRFQIAESEVADRFAILAGGNVGIGTTAPGHLLDIVGGHARIYTDDKKMYWGASEDLAIYHSGDHNFISGSTGDIKIQNTANNQDVSLIVNDGGTSNTVLNVRGQSSRVGIGYYAPSAKLDVRETTEQLRLSYDTSNYASFTVADDGALTIATVDADAALADIILAPDGNVGIGITSPAEPLHVVGDVAFSAVGSTYSGDRIVGAIGGLQFIANGGNAMKLTGTGLGIGTTAPSYPLHVAAADTGLAALFTNTSSNGEVMRLTTTGDSRTMHFQTDHIYMNGGAFHIGNDNTDMYLRVSGKRLGVGTSNPTSGFLMDVSGSTRQYGSFSLVNGAITSNPGTNHLWASGATLFWGTSQIGTTTPGAGAIEGTATAGEVAYGDGSNSITSTSNFTFADDVGMTIQSSVSDKPVITLKNTNANNSAPLLDFIKDSASPAASDDLAGIRFYGDDSGGAQHNFARIDVESPVVTAGAEVGSIKFRTTDGGTDNTGVMILSGANVGIGTTSPVKTLHIKKDAGHFRISSADYDLISMGPRGDTGSNLDKAGLNMMASDGSSKVFIDTAGDSYFNGGDVGIGTSAPNAPLDVYNTSTQQRWSYNGSYYTDMTVESDGDTTLQAKQGSLSLKTDTGGKTIRLDSKGDVMIDLGGSAGTYLMKVVDSSANWLFTTHDNGNVGIHTGSLQIKERAAAPSDAAAYGQFWVKTATPNKPYFTDDAGTDFDLTAGEANVFSGAVPDTYIPMASGGADILRGFLPAYVDVTTDNNVFLGTIPASLTGDADQNTSFGHLALENLTTGDANTAVGMNAGNDLTQGYYNTFIGYSAGGWKTTEIRNTAVGYAAGSKAGGGDNVSIGAWCGYGGTGDYNVLIGSEVAYNATSINRCVVIGRQAANAGTFSGNENVLIGYKSGYAATSGKWNTAVGTDTMGNMTTASGNIAVGYQAGVALTTGTNNVFVGRYAGKSTTTVNYNTYIGDSVGKSGSTADKNTAIGNEALLENDTGGNNTAIGYQTLYNTTDSCNVALGHQAGKNNTSGGGNVFIGCAAGPSSTNTDDNKLYIHNAEGTPLIAGDFSAGTVTINGVLSATAKSFNIPHPLYKDKRLVHGSLEGPEHGLYIRGTIEAFKGCLIELPEYWSAMCEDYTVQLTPHGAYTVYIKEKQKDKVMIECSEENYKFDYYIVGARTDETLEVVQDG